MEGVIFDFNGTLFLDHDKHILAWDKISRELRNKGITQEELLNHINGRPNWKTIRFFNGGLIDEKLEEEYSKKKEAVYRDICRSQPESFHLIQGAEELFDDLKERGIPFTIASASIKDNIDFFVESFHLDRWIDPELIVYDDGSFPDKKAMFVKAAKNIGIPLESAVIVEDSRNGIDAALELGAKDIRIIDSAGASAYYRSEPAIAQVMNDLTEMKID